FGTGPVSRCSRRLVPCGSWRHVEQDRVSVEGGCERDLPGKSACVCEWRSQHAHGRYGHQATGENMSDGSHSDDHLDKPVGKPKRAIVKPIVNPITDEEWLAIKGFIAKWRPLLGLAD